MQKRTEYKNALIVIDFEENPLSGLLNGESHTISLSVLKLEGDQIVDKVEITRDEDVILYNGQESTTIAGRVQTYENIGKRFIDRQYQDGGSPVMKALVENGFDSEE